MSRGVMTFAAGIGLVALDMVLLFTAADPMALARRGVGLFTPLGVILAVASGPLDRRRPA